MKQQLRTELLAQRRKLDENFIITQSDNMGEVLYASPYYQQANIIMLFLSMPDEPQMMNIIEHAWRLGKKVCVPHMQEKFGIMDAAIIKSQQGLVRGRFNLLVPDPTDLTLVDPKLIDLIIVPAVAYDDEGNRLGMGAGYYDRFIPQAPNATCIGAIWSSQIIDKVPTDQYDRPVHYLLTEDAIIQCAGNKK
jgi:5-formyltetrahydrofolate cyclo-ligase